MARTQAQAIEWAQGHVGKFGWDNLCLSFVRQSFGIDYIPASWPASERDAGTAWDRAKHKHPTSDAGSIPRGVPVFFELATVADHVVLSLGNGWCLSNDFVQDGRIDKVRISDIASRWGRLLGWTEDLVGNRVVPERNPVNARRVDGVDISHHQGGTIDYAAAKKAGVKWIYHKATEGATFTDPNYARRRAEAKKAGIPFGAYHFARAGRDDAAAEARHLLITAKPVPGDLRPALDLETTEGLSTAQLRTWAAEFVDEVKRQTGVLPVIYTPYDLRGAVPGECIIWRPRYNDSNTPPELPWDIWQFSNGVLGKPDDVAGFGHVDLNTMRDGVTTADLRIPKPKRVRRWRGKLEAVFYNVGDGPDAVKRIDLSRFVEKGAKLILLAECSDRVDMLKAWAKGNGWHYWPGDGSPGAAATPALIHPDLYPCVASLSTTEAVPSTLVGDPGAGPRQQKRKVVQKVRISRRFKVGIPRRALRIVWGHYGPSATRADLPNHELREKLHRQHTAANLKATSKGKSLTFVVADFNCEFDHRLMAPYRAAGFEQLHTGPTHGRNTIDYWLVKKPRKAPKAFTVSGSSDHHAVAVVIP
jgi:GH25 family lysozyme M1 (1,4-beta-N-acetylmuramidase)